MITLKRYAAAFRQIELALTGVGAVRVRQDIAVNCAHPAMPVLRSTASPPKTVGSFSYRDRLGHRWAPATVPDVQSARPSTPVLRKAAKEARVKRRAGAQPIPLARPGTRSPRRYTALRRDATTQTSVVWVLWASRSLHTDTARFWYH